MRHTLRVRSQKIFIVRDNDPSCLLCKCEVFFIRGTEEIRVDGGGRVDTTDSQSMSDCRIDVLVKMEPKHCPYPMSRVCVAEGRGRFSL